MISPNEQSTFSLYSQLNHLVLSGVKLSSLTNLPQLNSLEVLDLEHNELDGNDLSSVVTAFPNLRKINLAYNNIHSIQTLKHLNQLTQLRKIDIHGNPCMEYDFDRESVYKMLPRLTVLNHINTAGEQVFSSIDDSDDNEDDYNELSEAEDDESAYAESIENENSDD